MDRYELRRLDYSLTKDHEAVQEAYKQFFKSHCSIETVRAAEESGFDKGLWERLCAMGATTMALPESVGGDGATLVDLTLVAEEIGRALAPVPWIDHVCAARLLARLDALNPDAVNGKQIVALDPQHESVSGVRLIPVGSIPDHIIVRDGDDVVRLTFDTRPVKVDNIGRLPMAWVDPGAADSRTVVASGPDALAEYQRALDEWRLLTGSALVGLVEETMNIAAEFAKTRYTLGVPISTLQAISHPLANIAITVQGGRNLAGAPRGFSTTSPTSGGSWRHRHLCLWPRKRPRRPPWRCISKAGLVFRPRRPLPLTWCGLGAGRWPAAIRVPARSTSPRSSRPAKPKDGTSPWISHESSYWPTIKLSSRTRGRSSRLM
jgi:Acyl-CoA dehydrogenase, N-terminal domain/Acyl-CoA dehydrogenase, C-terminal domain